MWIAVAAGETCHGQRTPSLICFAIVLVISCLRGVVLLVLSLLFPPQGVKDAAAVASVQHRPTLHPVPLQVSVPATADSRRVDRGT